MTTDPAVEAAAQLRRIGLVVTLGSIMAVLDVTIVNVALNPIALDLDASLPAVQWVSSGYALALAAVMPASAWAMNRFGTRAVYLTCLALFAAGSALATAAWNIESLIAFRVLQGIGGGMLMPTGMTIIMRAAGREQIGLATRIMSLPLLVAPLLGPVFGGVLVDAVSWRAMFAVNLPVGVLAAVLGARMLPRDAHRTPRPLDVVGLLLLSPGLALALFAVTRAAETARDVVAVLSGVVGVALVVAFVLRSLRSAHPLIDLGLLRRRSVAGSSAVLMFFAAGHFGCLLLAPLYFQLARDRSVAVSGLLVAPVGLSAAVTMQVLTRRFDRVGPARVVRAGIPVALLGMVAFVVQIGPDTPYWRLCASLAVMGVGVGATIMPAIAAANTDLAPAEVPSANTTVQVVLQLAGAVGTTIVATVLAAALAARIPGAGDGGGLGAVQALDAPALHRALEPLIDAFRVTYLVGLGLFVAAFVPAWVLARGRAAPRPPGLRSGR